MLGSVAPVIRLGDTLPDAIGDPLGEDIRIGPYAIGSSCATIMVTGGTVGGGGSGGGHAGEMVTTTSSISEGCDAAPLLALC